MAAAMVACRSRAVVRRVRDMKPLLHSLRTMSSHDSKDTVYHEMGDQNAKRVWPDREFVLYDPYDQQRFPLPGNTAPALFHTQMPPPSIPAPSSRLSLVAEVLATPSGYQNQVDVLGQHNSRLTALSGSDEEVSGRASLDVEVKVQDCPLLIRKDFQLLFPGSDVMTGDFTVVSLCQRTDNDMSGWSEQLETERESLIELYCETAKEICSVLHGAGFWADFIDPCSGKPHIGPYTTDSMFETDERYRHFGFDIEDLGCCKVIKHYKWGTKSFVGCIFTNASIDAPVLIELTQFTHAKNPS